MNPTMSMDEFYQFKEAKEENDLKYLAYIEYSVVNDSLVQEMKVTSMENVQAAAVPVYNESGEMEGKGVALIVNGNTDVLGIGNITFLKENENTYEYEPIETPGHHGFALEREGNDLRIEREARDYCNLSLENIDEMINEIQNSKSAFGFE